MPRNSTQYVCLNALAAALLCGAADAQSKAPDGGEPDVLVYLKKDDLTPNNAVIARAKETAASMFAGIGVRLAWAAEGTDSPAATAVVLHLQVTDRPQAGFKDAAVAYAHPYAGGTEAITIMWDRLQARCLSSPSLAPVLLAHVIVHEITHVLQAVKRHSDTGVMKAQWNTDDYRAMLWKPLPFTDDDISLVRSGLARLRGLARANADRP